MPEKKDARPQEGGGMYYDFLKKYISDHTCSLEEARDAFLAEIEESMESDPKGSKVKKRLVEEAYQRLILEQH